MIQTSERFAILPAGVALDDPDAFAIRVEGDALEPEYHDRDVVIVSPRARWRKGEHRIVLMIPVGDVRYTMTGTVIAKALAVFQISGASSVSVVVPGPKIPFSADILYQARARMNFAAAAGGPQ